MGYSYESELILVIRINFAGLIEGMNSENYKSIMNLVVTNYVDGTKVPAQTAQEGYMDSFGILKPLCEKDYNYVKNQLEFFRSHYGNRDILLKLKTICAVEERGYTFAGSSHRLVSIPTMKQHFENPFISTDQEILYKNITENMPYDIICMVRLRGG